MLLVLLINLALVNLTLQHLESTHIVGGLNVGKLINKKTIQNSNKYPYLVLLEFSELISNKFPFDEVSAICGGTILSPKVVLTAAHCLELFTGVPHVTVTAGFVHRKLEKPAHKTFAKNYFIHERFRKLDDVISADGDFYDQNDIALLWVNDKFKFNERVQPASLNYPGGALTAGTEGKVMGWGFIDFDRESDMLKDGTLRVLARQECKIGDRGITNSHKMFCALSDTKETTVCIGDSGGPFVVNGVVVGVSSFNEQITTESYDGQRLVTCDPEQPTVFISILEYLPWIRLNIKRKPQVKQLMGLSCRRNIMENAQKQSERREGCCRGCIIS